MVDGSSVVLAAQTVIITVVVLYWRRDSTNITDVNSTFSYQFFAELAEMAAALQFEAPGGWDQ